MRYCVSAAAGFERSVRATLLVCEDPTGRLDIVSISSVSSMTGRVARLRSRCRGRAPRTCSSSTTPTQRATTPTARPRGASTRCGSTAVPAATYRTTTDGSTTAGRCSAAVNGAPKRREGAASRPRLPRPSRRRHPDESARTPIVSNRLNSRFFVLLESTVAPPDPATLSPATRPCQHRSEHMPSCRGGPRALPLGRPQHKGIARSP